MRLLVSYKSNLYARCDQYQPWHPDRMIAESVCLSRYATRINFDRREVIFDGFDDRFWDVVEARLTRLGFDVQASLLEVTRDGNCLKLIRSVTMVARSKCEVI